MMSFIHDEFFKVPVSLLKAHDDGGRNSSAREFSLES